MSAESQSPAGAELTLADLLRDLKRHGLTLSLAQENYLVEVDGDVSGAEAEYTLHRVYQAIYRWDKEITKERAIDLVNEMQNAGILFRKRRLQADEVVNATELPEAAARRYARQLLQLQEGLKERGVDLTVATEEDLAEWALAALDQRDADAKTNAKTADMYSGQISAFEEGLRSRGWIGNWSEDWPKWVLKTIDELGIKPSKLKLHPHCGSPIGPVISGLEISIQEYQNVLADVARLRARTRIERNSGEII